MWRITLLASAPYYTSPSHAFPPPILQTPTMALKRLTQELGPLEKEKWAHIEVGMHLWYWPSTQMCADFRSSAG